VNVVRDVMKARAKRREWVIKPPEFESMKTSHNTGPFRKGWLY